MFSNSSREGFVVRRAQACTSRVPPFFPLPCPFRPGKGWWCTDSVMRRQSCLKAALWAEAPGCSVPAPAGSRSGDKLTILSPRSLCCSRSSARENPSWRVKRQSSSMMKKRVSSTWRGSVMYGNTTSWDFVSCCGGCVGLVIWFVGGKNWWHGLRGLIVCGRSWLEGHWWILMFGGVGC